MKKHVVSFFLILAPFILFSQHFTNDTVSNIENALNRKGVIIMKEYGGVIRSKSGTLKLPGSCNYETVIITDLESGIKTGGLRITSLYNYTIGNSVKTDEYIAYLDPDEINGCVNFLKKFSNDYIKTSPDKYTELVYTTYGGFSIGCFYNQKEKNPEWKVLIKTKQFNTRSFVSIDKDDIPVLIEDFKKAYQDILSSIGK